MPSRRGILEFAGISGAALLGTAACTTERAASLPVASRTASKAPAKPAKAEVRPHDAASALAALVRGNQRWYSSHAEHPHADRTVRASLTKGQHPFVTVLGCMDSRVPPELIFDQGLGDMFTLRTAGQVLDEAVLGSVSYGIVELGIPLIVVLGHQKCGAVTAAVEAVEKNHRPAGHLATLVEKIRPAVEQTSGTDHLGAAINANIRMEVDALTRDSDVAPYVRSGKVKIVGARYDLTTGKVTFQPR